MNFLQMIQESAFDHHSTLQMQRLPESQQSDYEIFRSVCKDAQLCDGCRKKFQVNIRLVQKIHISYVKFIKNKNKVSNFEEELSFFF